MLEERCDNLGCSRLRRRAISLLMGAVFVVLAGCASSGPSRGQSRGPSRGQIRKPPANLEPHRVILGLIGKVADTDSNRYPDSLAVMVFIYGNHEVPITPLGTFMFRLIDDDNEELVRWDLSQEEAQAAVSNRNLAGPAFTFRLNIQDHISDKMDAVSLRLMATFSPLVGEPLHAVGPGYVQFGR